MGLRGLIARLRRLRYGLEVVVASAEVSERIRVVEEAPPYIEVGPGRLFTLLVPFRVTGPEATVTLVVQVDDAPPSVSTRGRKRQDVHRRLRLRTPGRHRIKYTVIVEREMQMGGRFVKERKEVSGRLSVEVSRHARVGHLGTGVGL